MSNLGRVLVNGVELMTNSFKLH